jgi:hypothetical protein
MGLLQNGIFGMGGMGAVGGTKPPAGLLGAYFDPAEMRKQQFKQGLLNMSISMLQNGKGSTGEVLGNSFGAGLQGANQAGINYKQDAMGYQQMAQQQDEQKEKERNKAAVMQWLDGLPEDQQELARVNPQMAAESYMKQQFAGSGEGFTLGEGQQRFDATGKPIASGTPNAPKPPQIETFFDEKTGQQYKAQFNPATQKWDRVGGTKSDSNGITITNPDGTVTQIGGSGGAKTTEADRRANLLTQQIVGQEASLMQAFDSLATGQNTVGSATGTAGRAFMTAEGQNADDALKNVAANWLYLTSGATATDAEVDRQFSMIKPTALDKPENIIAKKARLQSMIDTMKMRSGMTVNPATPPGPANVETMSDEELEAIVNGQ